MKLNIKTLNITLNAPNPPDGLLAALTILAPQAFSQDKAPAIGEQWPGLDATYAGISLSSDGNSLAHLLLWNENPKENLEYDAAVTKAESIHPETGSHLPTRHQSITLFDNLQDHFERDYWHWTLTKTKSGKAAFYQDFSLGLQDGLGLSYEARVRAVSEIPL